MSSGFQNSRSMSSRSSQDRDHNSMRSNPVLIRWNPYPFPIFEYPIVPSISLRSSQVNNKYNRQFQPQTYQFSTSQDNTNHYQSKLQPPNATNLLESLYNVGWYLKENRNSGLSPALLLENAMISNNMPCDVIMKSSSDLLTFYCFVVCCSVLIGFVEDSNRVSAEIKAIQITIENLSRSYLKIVPKEADFDELVSSDFPIDDACSNDRSYKQAISPVPNRFTTQEDDRYDRIHNEVEAMDSRQLSPPRNGWNQLEQKRNYPGPSQESHENYPFYTDAKRNTDTYRSPSNLPSTFSPHPKYEGNWSLDQRRQSFDSLERTSSIPRFSDRYNVEESYLKPLPTHPSPYEEIKVTIRGAASDDRGRREESLERRQNSEQIIIDRRREESLERRRKSEQIIIDRRREESIERQQISEQIIIDKRRGNSELRIKDRNREESFECKRNSDQRIKERKSEESRERRLNSERRTIDRKREESRERKLNSERRIKDKKNEESSGRRRASERGFKDRKRENSSERKLNSERAIKDRNRAESNEQRHSSERRIKDRKRVESSERRRNSEKTTKDRKREESRERKGNSERKIKDITGLSQESWRNDSYQECTGNDYGWVRTVSSAHSLSSPQSTFENIVSSSTSPDRLTDKTQTRFKTSSDEKFNIFRTVSNERASPARRSTFQAQSTETHQLPETPYKVTSKECPNQDQSTDHQHLLEPFYKVGHSLRKYQNLHSNPAELLEHALSTNNLSFDSVMGSSKDHSIFYCVVVCSSVQISFAKARNQTNAETKAIQIAIENLSKPYLNIIASDGGMGKLIHSDSP